MILLGIDPGTAATGYGVIKIKKDNGLKLLDYGNIRTLKQVAMQDRLLKIYNSTKHLVEKFSPDAIIVERLFFNTNAKTALSVGQARGIYLLVGGEYDIPIFEYTALEAKMVLTGYGRAHKNKVREKVARLLNVKDLIRPIDASDALAMAICHSHKINNQNSSKV